MTSLELKTSEIIAPGNGSVYFGINSGAAITAGGVYLADAFAEWNGNQFTSPKFDMSAVSFVGRSAFYDNATKDVYWLGTSESATVEGRTTIANADYSDTYPTLVVLGPGTIYGIQNYTNGDRVDFNNLTLLEGQTFTVVFAPDGIISARIFAGSAANPRGGQNGGTDVTKFIVPGSSPTFRLSPGINSIGLYVYGGTTAATAATLSWPSTYRAIEGAVR